MKITFAILIFLLFPACAVLDPHNIVGRRFSTESTDVVAGSDTRWRQAALDEVWTTINERYYDPGLNGVDWKAARTRHEPGILAAASDDEYWERLDKMAGEMRDSHTRVHSPKQAAQQRSFESHSLGFSFQEMGDALVVTSVHAESDAYWAGVRSGMTISMIDGEPALKKYQQLLAEVRNTSTAWARARGAQRKISAGEIGTSVSMSFKRTEGGEINTTLQRRRFVSPPSHTVRKLPSGFGYVRFSEFNETLAGSVRNAIAGLRDAPGMILDLRNNGGGSLRMATEIASQFFIDTRDGARVLTRTGKPVTVAFIPVINLETKIVGNPATAYTKPLVVLTNENSASASEVLAGTLQSLGRATVLGQRTCGCLLGYLGYADLPGGGKLAYSELGFMLPDGRRIEGEGVMPTMNIVPTRDDLMLNRDRALEAAEVFLKEKTAGNILK